MAYLIISMSKSGAGKSEVFEYVKNHYPQFYPMYSYTSRPPRNERESGYIFKDTQYFVDHKEEFVELATFPPRGNPLKDESHFYGKHQSQFDGKNYIMAMDEVGVLALDKLIKEGKLPGYELVRVFITCDDEKIYERVGHDKKRIERDAKRKFLPLDYFDYVFDNNGKLEELHKQVDEMVSSLK